MKNVIVRDGKIYSESFGKVDVFEVVDKIPAGFFRVEHRGKYGS